MASETDPGTNAVIARIVRGLELLAAERPDRANADQREGMRRRVRAGKADEPTPEICT